MDRKNTEETGSLIKQDNPAKEVHERTGSNEHNDYRITGKNDAASTGGKDEKDSYQDYNGNADDNNPARAER